MNTCENSWFDVFRVFKSITSNQLFSQVFIKIHEFIPILLDSLLTNDDNFIVQIFVIEQYLSLCALATNHDVLGVFISNEEKLIKIIQILIQKHFALFDCIIVNFMEFCVICLHRNCQNLVSFIINFINLVLIDTTELNQNVITQDNYSSKIGALQLYNRTFYLGLTPIQADNYSKELIILELIGEIITKYYIKINILNQNMLLNLLINFKCYFKCINNKSIVENINIIILKLKDQSYLGYMNKDDHTLAHWLMFYNKINNDVHIYQLTKREDELKFLWKSKLESANYMSVDLSQVKFLFKYEVLKNDVMYKDTSRADD